MSKSPNNVESAATSNEPIEPDMSKPMGNAGEPIEPAPIPEALSVEGQEAEDEEEQQRLKAERLAQVTSRPQTFAAYDAYTMFECIERRDGEKLKQVFNGLHGVEVLFKTNFVTGIDSSTIEARREQWGLNVLDRKEPATFLEFLLESLEDRVVQILIAAAVVSIVFGMTLENPHTGKVDREAGWIEGVAIIISVLIVTLTGSINNYQKAKKFEEMEKEQAAKPCVVIRDGAEKNITTDELCVGDVMQIETGNEMTCDGLTVRPQSLKMDEAAITGESDLVAKDTETNPFILSGTHVEEGDALVVVVGVGMGSLQGILKKQLDKEAEETPLQEHLTELADDIGLFGLGAAILLILSLSLKEIINNTTKEGRTWSAVTFLNFLLIAVALVAVAIPEGLPLAVTIALAFSMKAMMKDNCMVRVLASCETMGAATAVCSDKTGTLTTNDMTVVQGLIAGEEFVFDEYGLKRRNDKVSLIPREANAIEHLAISKDVQRRMAVAIAVNSTAGEAKNDEGKLVWKGNKTELSMLKFITYSLTQHYATIRSENEERHSFPFSSKKKRMSTLVRRVPGKPDCALYCKGASEAILLHCKFMFDANDQIVPLDADSRREYDAIIVDMAKQGNRTIGIAMSKEDVQFDHFPVDDMTDEVELVWLGVVGIQDPLRQAVPRAVLDCHSAHLTVRMVTGDNLHTAVAIASKCHIYEDNGFDIAMTGSDFREMANGTEEQQAELKAMIPRLRVLARSSPSDKHILVGLLKEAGEVVAVTGDGTNDAPALKLADVGFAMNSGTDIAKGASHMILLDDNFASVVNAIKWGRAVNDNVKKFLQFQLSINVAGVLLTIVGSLISEHSKEPFKPVQMLWLNLIMDTLAALSLSTELPEEACLTREPVYKQAPLITNRMRLFIGAHATFQFGMILAILLDGHNWFKTVDSADCDRDFDRSNATSPDGLAYSECQRQCLATGGNLDGRYCQQGYIHSTMIFNIFIWFQVFNVINARKIYGEMNPLEGVFTRSRNLILIFLIIGGLQAIAVELTYDFMSVRPLSAKNWGICIGFGALELVVGILVRFIPVTDAIPEEITERKANLAKLREECINSHSRIMIDSMPHPKAEGNQPRAFEVSSGEPANAESVALQGEKTM